MTKMKLQHALFHAAVFGLLGLGITAENVALGLAAAGGLVGCWTAPLRTRK